MYRGYHKSTKKQGPKMSPCTSSFWSRLLGMYQFKLLLDMKEIILTIHFPSKSMDPNVTL